MLWYRRFSIRCCIKKNMFIASKKMYIQCFRIYKQNSNILNSFEAPKDSFRSIKCRFWMNKVQ